VPGRRRRAQEVGGQDAAEPEAAPHDGAEAEIGRKLIQHAYFSLSLCSGGAIVVLVQIGRSRVAKCAWASKFRYLSDRSAAHWIWTGCGSMVRCLDALTHNYG
jgi:hypothetical protein